MLVSALLEKKRDGFEHTREEIEFIVNGMLNGDVQDYQATAWMMAVCCRGMSENETAYLTSAMVASGETVDLSELPGYKLDKHSTGGVGDTTTLIVAPLVAACGGTVAKMSGRGLAHSGGTLDKLESVPGVSVEQPLERFKKIVRDYGVCVVGQSGDLDPADKKMYALRDVSGTVKSIPLIASSIMSKKIASGANGIVLDVKAGNGAFMSSVEEARQLALEMVKIGRNTGRNTVAVITDMNRPLGMAIGNGLEMREAIQALTGRLPYSDPLMEVSFCLAACMLKLAGLSTGLDDARPRLMEAIESGEAFGRLRGMLAALGGDVKFVDEPDKLAGSARIAPVYPKKEGYIGAMDAKKLGLAALMLGAGREKVTDTIDPAVGILMKKRYGDYIKTDEPLANIYFNDERKLDEAVLHVMDAITITAEKPPELPLIYDIIE